MQDFAHQMQWLVDVAYPDAPVVRVVLDNLNTHRMASLYETFPPAEAGRIAKRLEFHHTPKHASWLNMAEIEFSALSRAGLKRRNPGTDALQRTITAYETQRNTAGVTINWRFSTQDARSVIADIKMCKNAEMELTQPKVVASSADTRRRCRRHIAKGGSSERDIRDERRWPFDPGDRQGAGGIAEHGAPVSAIAGGHAAEGAATKRVEAGSVHRVHRRADGGGVGKLRGAAAGS